MKKTKWYLIILYIFIFIGISGAIYSTVFTPFKNISFWNDTKITNLKDWSFIDSSGINSSISLPAKLNVEAGENSVLSATLPNIKEYSNTLCFKTEHSYVKVYAGNDLIYSFGNQDDIPFGQSPGRVWNMVNIDPKYQESVITIKIMCPYEKFSGEINSIYYGSQGSIIQYIFRQVFPFMIVSFFPLLFGVLLLVLSPIVYRESKTVLFQTLAILMIDISLWSLVNSGFLQFYFGSAFGIGIVGYITFALIPTITIVALWELGIIQNKKLFNLLFYIDAIAFVGVCVLQALNLADFFITIPFIHLIIVINAVLYLIDYAKILKRNKKRFLNTYSFMALLLIFIFSLFDILGNGYLYIYGMLIFIVLISVWVIRNTLKLHYDNIEKDTYKKIAQTDDLTGLGNRRAFNESLKDREYNTEKTTIVFIDLNCLKAVNDKKGHAFGDEYIIITSDLIREFENKGASCFRIGGDEFCVLGSDLEDDYVDLICNQINIELERQKELFGISLSMSFGYAHYDPEKDMNIFQCLSRADANMYKNKNQWYKKS